MKYKLALALKNTGFFDKDKKSPHYQDKKIQNALGNPIRTPTLDELIGACGDEFCGLIRFISNGVWECNGIGKKIGRISTQANTPEEAVANLWLKLNDTPRRN